MIGRIPIVSPTTSGRRRIDSVLKIAAWGWLMMDCPATEPSAPVLFRVNVPSRTSSGRSNLLRAREARSLIAFASSMKPIRSASLTTGTISVSGSATAMPMLT